MTVPPSTPNLPRPDADGRVSVGKAADLDAAAITAVAGGAGIELAEELLAALARRRTEALSLLDQGPEVYGVSTGMGALSGVRLDAEQQARHSDRLMLARAVGGPPWLERSEARAVIATRLRSFLAGDAAVSPELCAWLAALLDHDDLVAEIPRTGSGSAGEILPLAHAWEHLAGAGERAAKAQKLGAPRLGPKEGLALLAGTPIASALAILRVQEGRALLQQMVVVASASIALVQASRDPYEAATARGDATLAEVLSAVRELAGSAEEVAETPAAPRSLQAPVSFRVVGPTLAHLQRSLDNLAQSADRSLRGVSDSPALLDTASGLRFVGTSGFHGIDLAAGLDALSTALVHCASVSLARLHRMLDAGVTGLAPQLSAQPGPMAGLTPLHKWAAGRLQETARVGASTGLTMETSQGQEDVQSFALAAAERLREALQATRQVLACELLAVHQARGMAPERLSARVQGHQTLSKVLDEVAQQLPVGTDDRPWGRDVQALQALLSSGWALDLRFRPPGVPD